MLKLTFNKSLHLITSLTPNERKVHILLEELKEAYGLEWTTSLIDLDKNEQKKDWFLRLNPNGASFLFHIYISFSTIKINKEPRAHPNLNRQQYKSTARSYGIIR